MLSVGANRFEGQFGASIKVGWGNLGGCAHGGCPPWLYKSLGRHWLNHFLPLLAQLGIEAPSSTVGSFQSGGAFADQRVLTIESSLMSGCGEATEKVSNKLWLKF